MSIATPIQITDFSNWFVNTTYPPAKGVAHYVNNQTLMNGLRIDSDYTTVGSRPAIRVQSPFTIGTAGTWFAATVSHTPTGCGVWPALWLKGTNLDEVDMYESVSSFESIWNIHTTGLCFYNSQNCTYPPPPGWSGPVGCQKDLDIYPTSSANALVYNLSFSTTTVDLSINGNSVFSLPTSCSLFTGMQVIINTNFCGPWTDQTYGSCAPSFAGSTGVCENDILANPAQVSNAYWVFDSMSVMPDPGSAILSSISSASATATASSSVTSSSNTAASTSSTGSGSASGPSTGTATGNSKSGEFGLNEGFISAAYAFLVNLVWFL